MFFKLLGFVFLVFLSQGGFSQNFSDEKCHKAAVSKREDFFSKAPLNQEKYLPKNLKTAMRGALPLPQILSLYPPLPEDLQNSLLKTYQAKGRNRSSREFDVIFLSSWRLIYKIVKKLSGGPHSDVFQDYFQTALIQLMESIDNFDFNRQSSFGSYTGVHVRYSVMNTMSQNKPVAGASNKKIVADVKRALNNSHFSEGDNETVLNQVLKQYPVSLHPQVLYWYWVYRNSLTTSVDIYEEPYLLRTDPRSDLHKSIDIQKMRDYAEAEFSNRPKHLAIVNDRIFSPTPVFHRILAERFGVSVARMQQIEQSVLEKLRKKFSLVKNQGMRGERVLPIEDIVSNRLRQRFSEFFEFAEWAKNQNTHEAIDVTAMREFVEAEFSGQWDYMAVIRSRIFSVSSSSLEELAKRLGVTAQRLKQIEDIILVRLWEKLTENQDENLYESQARDRDPALNL